MGGTEIPKFSTKGCSAPAAHQAGFLDSAAWGGPRRLLLPTWVQTEPGPLPQGSVLPSRKCLEAKEAPRRGQGGGRKGSLGAQAPPGTEGWQQQKLEDPWRGGGGMLTG